MALGPQGGLLQADGLRVITLKTSESSGPPFSSTDLHVQRVLPTKSRTWEESPGVRGPNTNDPLF